MVPTSSHGPRASRPANAAHSPRASRPAHAAHAGPTAPAPVPETVEASFDGLGLSEATLRTLAAEGFEHPTVIQARAIPPALSGRDVIGCAATGTGKTAAFALPLIERFADKPGTRGLVLAPTRELAVQIAEQVTRFGAGRRVRATLLIGGVPYGTQRKHISEKRSIIIATPGRLIDFLDEGEVSLDGIEVLVLDEADRMLDMGFKPQLTRILAKVPKRRQTLLFSATMDKEVAEFARANSQEPIRVEVSRSGTTALRVEQRVYLSDNAGKTAALIALLAQDEASTLVFTRTKSRADRLTRSLEQAGFHAARIHAGRSQGQRRQALEGFREGRYRVLVATDIAARGIDVVGIGHVVNFDLPHVPEDYVHRIGRTGRAQASGKASSLVSREEVSLLKNIERLTRQAIARANVPLDTSAPRKPIIAAPEAPDVRRFKRSPTSRFGAEKPSGDVKPAASGFGAAGRRAGAGVRESKWAR